MGSRAYVVSIDVDGRQAFIFETDRLREMLGASRLVQQTVDLALELFRKEDQLHLFQPVSGEIRVWAGEAQRELLLVQTWKARRWLADRGIEHTCCWMEVDRKHFEETNDEPADPGRPRDEPPEDAGLSWVQRALSARASYWKGRKPGADARPTCSLFAPCQIHGHDFATEWRTGQDRDQQDERRNLRGARAQAKFHAWEAAKNALFATRLYQPALHVTAAVERLTGRRPTRPIEFDHLTNTDAAQGDQFIAFICADGDGMGQVLTGINWNHSTLKRHGAPWEVNRGFAMALDECVNEAYGEALSAVLSKGFAEEALRLQAEGRKPVLPLLPQLLGGDDLWTLCRKDVALPFCCAFADAFRRQIAKREVIGEAVRTAGVPPESLTISMGVAFAKAGHPAHAMIESAESMLRSAKELRRSPGSPHEGCIDWHWIDASLAQTVADARREGWGYVADGVSHSLTSRPWTITQCRAYLRAASTFNYGISADQLDGQVLNPPVPRRKREQIESILRRGGALTLLGWEAWLKSLTAEEIKTLGVAVDALERVGRTLGAMPSESGITDKKTPWFASPGVAQPTTPFLDLLELANVLGTSEGAEHD